MHGGNNAETPAGKHVSGDTNLKQGVRGRRGLKSSAGRGLKEPLTRSRLGGGPSHHKRCLDFCRRWRRLRPVKGSATRPKARLARPMHRGVVGGMVLSRLRSVGIRGMRSQLKTRTWRLGDSGPGAHVAQIPADRALTVPLRDRTRPKTSSGLDPLVWAPGFRVSLGLRPAGRSLLRYRGRNAGS